MNLVFSLDVPPLPLAREEWDKLGRSNKEPVHACIGRAILRLQFTHHGGRRVASSSAQLGAVRPNHSVPSGDPNGLCPEIGALPKVVLGDDSVCIIGAERVLRPRRCEPGGETYRRVECKRAERLANLV